MLLNLRLISVNKVSEDHNPNSKQKNKKINKWLNPLTPVPEPAGQIMRNNRRVAVDVYFSLFVHFLLLFQDWLQIITITYFVTFFEGLQQRTYYLKKKQKNILCTEGTAYC